MYYTLFRSGILENSSTVNLLKLAWSQLLRQGISSFVEMFKSWVYPTVAKFPLGESDVKPKVQSIKPALELNVRDQMFANILTSIKGAMEHFENSIKSRTLLPNSKKNVCEHTIKSWFVWIKMKVSEFS